jgi:hypothetical protein
LGLTPLQSNDEDEHIRPMTYAAAAGSPIF